jgi:hypothetical protein
VIEAMIVDARDELVYQRIAAKAQHLRDLGLSDTAIARALGVSDGEHGDPCDQFAERRCGLGTVSE